MTFCRTHRLALGVALSVVLGSGAFLASPATGAPRQRPAPARANNPSPPAELTEHDVYFAYHRMAGSEPDFDALAELADANRPASSTPVRNEAAERRNRLAQASRRLRAAYAAFNLDQAFILKVNTEIFSYSEEEGGLPITVGNGRRVSLPNLVDRYRSYSLRFINASEVETIPAASAEEADQLLRAASLPHMGSRGHGFMTITFSFAGMLPHARGSEGPPLKAEILSAVVSSEGGQPVHEFRSTGSRASAAAARASGAPILRSASLGGIRIGQAFHDAQEVAHRSHPADFHGAFYDAVPEAVAKGLGHPECSAGVVADLVAFPLPLSPQDAYGSCLTAEEGGDDSPMVGQVVEATEVRFLPAATAVAVRAELENRFGPPLEDLSNRVMVWVGRDPEAPDAEGLVEVRSQFTTVAAGGPARQPGTLVAVTLSRFVPAADAHP